MDNEGGTLEVKEEYLAIWNKRRTVSDFLFYVSFTFLFASVMVPLTTAAITNEAVLPDYSQPNYFVVGPLVVVMSVLIIMRNLIIKQWFKHGRKFDFFYRMQYIVPRARLILQGVAGLSMFTIYVLVNLSVVKSLQFTATNMLVGVSLFQLNLLLSPFSEVLDRRFYSGLCLTETVEHFESSGLLNRTKLDEGLRSFEGALREHPANLRRVDIPHDSLALGITILNLRNKRFDRHLNVLADAMFNPTRDNLAQALNSCQKLLKVAKESTDIGIQTLSIRRKLLSPTALGIMSILVAVVLWSISLLLQRR